MRSKGSLQKNSKSIHGKRMNVSRHFLELKDHQNILLYDYYKKQESHSNETNLPSPEETNPLTTHDVHVKPSRSKKSGRTRSSITELPL
jgi:hypothetical protein